MGKKIKKNIAIYSLLGVVLFVFTFCVMEAKETKGEKNIWLQTSASESTSNKKIGWGLKRVKDHEQPDLGKVNRTLLDQYEGICLGNAQKKYLYLTFDEGYEAGYTEKILEVLKQNEVSATFFITAHYLNTNEELVKKMIENNNIVGNHTVNHKSMPDLSEEQIQQEVMNLHTAIYEKTGYEMKYIRPPKGEYSQRTLELSKKLGYQTVMWSFAYEDWDENKQKGESYANEMILSNLHNGGVLLLHGNSKDNANALDSVIKQAKAMGYEFKSLDEFER